MHRSSRLAALAAALTIATAAAATPPPALAAADPLVAEALEKRPEAQRARALVEAEQATIGQATAFEDPSLSVGYQNDGFTSLPYGEMETTWASFMLTQPLYWPGKQGLRGAIASRQAAAVAAAATRTFLSIEAEVRAGLLELVRQREQLLLLDKLEILWRQAEDLARTRYEVGGAPQSDLLRAQLERSRLAQRRITLLANERIARERLNRARGAPLDAAIETPRLEGLGAVEVPAVEAAVADALERSPELLQARLGAETGERSLELARAERLPDFGVSAGIMTRGALEPMWQVGLSVGLPIWGSRAKAVDEARARSSAAGLEAETVTQQLTLTTRERLAQLQALLETVKVYRSGLLVQSSATVDSVVAQYQVGRAGFSSVLEALASNFADQSAYVDSAAAVHQQAIALREVRLESGAALSAGGAGGGSMGSAAAGSSPSPAAGAAPAAAPASANSSSNMRGM